MTADCVENCPADGEGEAHNVYSSIPFINACSSAAPTVTTPPSSPRPRVLDVFCVPLLLNSRFAGRGTAASPRPRQSPIGLSDVPPRHARELAQANELVRRTAQLLRMAHAAVAEFMLEHPADHGALSSPLFLHKRHAPIWLMPDVTALKADCSASFITFPQCALGAPTQKYTRLLVSPPLAPALHCLPISAASTKRTYTLRGGSKTSASWTSRLHAAYPPDFNFFIARILGILHQSRFRATDTPLDTAATLPADAPTPPPAPKPCAAAATPEPAAEAALPSPPPTAERDRRPQPPAPLRRSLGDYPLRSREPSALLALRARNDKPTWGSGTGCVFAINEVSTDPRTRKQAMAQDRIGWGAAERAEIANHAASKIWTTIDRSEVPAGKSLVRLIWVYKRKGIGVLQ
eukprot:571434-Pleurochrysis_carterae.AAC.3